MRIRAVIWDIDGTLVDSEPLHLRALLHVCESHGVNISDLPVDHFVGVNVKDIWAALHDRFPARLKFTDWLDQLNRYYIAHANELRPMSGAADTIRRISLAGLRQAAVSSSNRPVVKANLHVLGIADLLECVFSLDDVRHGKPHPEPYLRALDRLRLHAAEACAVEDSATGIASARSAGIPVFGLGNRTLEARYHISCLVEIPQLLFGIEGFNFVQSEGLAR